MDGGPLGEAHHSLEEARPRGGRRARMKSEGLRREAALRSGMVAPRTGAYSPTYSFDPIDPPGGPSTPTNLKRERSPSFPEDSDEADY